jgi:serine/threonine-protein kinase
MSAADVPEGRRSPESPARRVDAPCDRFEAAWRAGQRPRIEDYLDEGADTERLVLARQLLVLELELRRAGGESPDPHEYRQRFFDHRDLVEAAFGSALATDARRADWNISHNLLVGLLALQNSFISRDELLTAFTGWAKDKARPLGQILLARGALDKHRHALLDALVSEHLKLHGGDPEKSLAALSSIGSVRDDLSQIADSEILASLTHVSAPRLDETADPYRTATHSVVGAPSAIGTRFRVLRTHARGGMGEVFVARDIELNRDVALKEMQERFADDPDSRARFEFEAEITGGLEHPGIVPVYGLGHAADGRPFYAMRFIRGDSLKEAVWRFHKAEKQIGRDRSRSALELRALLGRFIDVCDAVAYAHSRRVLHRDLKPDNIMLGKYGETLVVDWGLAKTLESNEPETWAERSELPLKPAAGSALEPTVAEARKGTPAYMSPEQAGGRLDQLGHRSDVYGLGATLYHLLTGHAPFEGEEIRELYRKILAGKFPRPRSLNPRASPALEAVCLKAMALEPQHRYESVLFLKADLERCLADETVSAWREPLLIRTGRWMRRHKTLTATTAVSAPLLLAPWTQPSRRSPGHFAISRMSRHRFGVRSGKPTTTWASGHWRSLSSCGRRRCASKCSALTTLTH